MPFTPAASYLSPQKTRNYSGNKFVHNNSSHSNGNASSSNNQPAKLTWSQRKALEKEEEDFSKMFQLFDSKAEIQYLNSDDDDQLAACVYGDTKIGKKDDEPSSAAPPKPQTSGYDFGEMLKDEKVSTGLGESWRKY